MRGVTSEPLGFHSSRRRLQDHRKTSSCQGWKQKFTESSETIWDIWGCTVIWRIVLSQNNIKTLQFRTRVDMRVSGILHHRHDLFLALMMTAGLGEPRQARDTIVILHACIWRVNAWVDLSASYQRVLCQKGSLTPSSTRPWHLKAHRSPWKYVLQTPVNWHPAKLLRELLHYAGDCRRDGWLQA